MAKKKMGRPPLKAGEKKSESLRLALRPAEKKALVTRAHAAGLTLTEYILRKCLE
jgi:hypothetical protein